MTMRYAGLCAAAVLAALAIQASSASALTMAECSAKYKAAKTAGTLNGMKWKDFRKAQCGSEAAAPAAAPAPATASAPAAAPAPKPTPAAAPAAATEAKPASAGRQAMYTRERACGAEWKAMKANGTRPAGMKWPQFWHGCDERMKAAGK
jgi:hypothetical protein